jgi:hypothetical protein
MTRERYGAEMPVPEWRERLVCSKCGSREIDMVPDARRRGEFFRSIKKRGAEGRSFAAFSGGREAK